MARFGLDIGESETVHSASSTTLQRATVVAIAVPGLRFHRFSMAFRVHENDIPLPAIASAS